MRFTTTSALAALLSILPADTVALAVEPTSNLTARAPIPGLNCVNNSPLISTSTVLANFDKMSKNLPYETCGNVFAPTMHVAKSGYVHASADGSTKFYVCNHAKSDRCITLGADKRLKVEDASKQCNGHSFWIREGDNWSFGTDPINNAECGLWP